MFRAWSHWRALSGSKHIEFLLDNKLITNEPSQILDDVYSNAQYPFVGTAAASAKKSSTASVDGEEIMLLHKSNGRRIAEALNIPELDIELDRAVWQVEKALSEKKELKEEERDLKKAAQHDPGEKK